MNQEFSSQRIADNSVQGGADDHRDQVVGAPDLGVRIRCVEGSGLSDVAINGHIEHWQLDEPDLGEDAANRRIGAQDHLEDEVVVAVLCKFVAFPIGAVTRTQPQTVRGDSPEARGADREDLFWFAARAGRGDDADKYVSPLVKSETPYLGYSARENDSRIHIQWTGGFHFIYGWLFGVQDEAEILDGLDGFFKMRRARFLRDRGSEFFQGQIQEGTSFVITLHDQQSN